MADGFRTSLSEIKNEPAGKHGREHDAEWYADCGYRLTRSSLSAVNIVLTQVTASGDSLEIEDAVDEVGN